MINIQKTIFAACLTAALGVGIYEAKQAACWREQARVLAAQSATLHERVSELEQTLESASSQAATSSLNLLPPPMPEPRLQFAGAAPLSPLDALGLTNLYALTTNQQVKLSKSQVEAYLSANHRSAASLLAAFRTTGEPDLLQEALKTFPSDPQVNFEAALRKDLSPEQRRQCLDALQRSAPDNALADYLSANDHIKAGQMDTAVQDMLAASGKTHFADYSLERLQEDEDAFRAANYSPAQAKTVATSQLNFPQLVALNDLSRNLLDLANSYQQAGDEASRQATLQMAVNLGKRYDDGAPGQNLISQMMGLSIERNALKAMDPAGVYDASGQTIQQRVDSLVQQRAAILQLANSADSLWPTLSEQDWMSYHDRSTAFGEEAAMRWLVAKFASH